MILIRSLIFNILFFGWTILLAVFSIPSVVFGKSAVSYVLHTWLKSVYFLEKHILNLTYTLRGLENLPETPYLVAMKHQSAWETMKLHIIFNDPAVVLKKELMDIPLWGHYAKLMEMIPVDRKRGSEAMTFMVKHAKQRVNDKRPIVIFPQGTRVGVGQKKKYKYGVIRLYEELHIPIVPVALNSGVYWPRKALVIKPGTIIVDILPPIPSGQNPQDVLRKLEETIETSSDRLCQEALRHDI